MNKYFDRQEFRCFCGKCGLSTVDAELLDVLTRLREYYKLPVIITSGNRCKTHNAIVGGTPKSKHLDFTAADIKVKGVSPLLVSTTLDDMYPDKYGIGTSEWFTHIDIRPTKNRWAY